MLALVGQHRGDVEVDAADAVRPDDLRQRVAVMADAELEVGAVVVEHLAAQPDHPVVGVERELGVVDAVGAVIVAAVMIVDAVLDVLDRPAADARERGRQDADLVGNSLLPKLPPAITGTRLILCAGTPSDSAMVQPT